MKHIGKFVSTWLSTSWEIIKAFRESSQKNQITKFWLFLSALRQTSSWAWYLLQRELFDSYRKRLWEILSTWNPKQKDKIEGVSNTVSDKIAILIPWYNLTDKSLVEVKNSLHKQWVQVESITTRMRNSRDMREIRSKVQDIINNSKWKQVVLFWYSSWWIIASRVAEKENIPYVWFWVPAHTQYTMITTLLELWWKAPKKPVHTPEGSISLVEEFSAMVPRTWELPDRTEVIHWVHSHMSVHQPRVVERVTQEVMKRFSS